MAAASFQKPSNSSGAWRFISQVGTKETTSEESHRLKKSDFLKVYSSGGGSSAGVSITFWRDARKTLDASHLLGSIVEGFDRPEVSVSIDAKDRKIIEALSEDKWDFRTVEGISNETGLSKGRVEEFLNKSSEVRLALAPNRKGERLYSLNSRRITAREVFAFIQLCITKRVW